MKNLRNRKNKFRNNGRNYGSNGPLNFKQSYDKSINSSFQRRSPGRNNHNASKLIEKYTNLASEALSSGDKILSENYHQHADHFLRISLKQNIEKNDKNHESINSFSEDKKIEISPQEEIIQKKQENKTEIAK